MLGLIAAGVIVGLTAIGAFAGKARAATPGGDASGGQARRPVLNTVQARQLDLLQNTILAVARKMAYTREQVAAAVAAALALGLPLTAKAVQSESRLPATELWPGTQLSVLAYIGGILTGPQVAAPRAAGTATPVVSAPGTVRYTLPPTR
jgi:hypothetical protein